MQLLNDVKETVNSGAVVVTGAGSGLGRSLAVALAKRGKVVAGFGRRLDALNETAALIEKDQFLPVSVDISEADAVSDAFAKVEKKLGPVTVLINNAAVHVRRDFLHETPQSFMDSVNINLGGVVNCSHAALVQMTQTGIGRIMNVGSFAHLAPQPTSSAYSVSKGAAGIFTDALIADIWDRFPNIVVNTWMPGILATDMGLPDGLDTDVAANWGAELALSHHQSLNGTTFDRDTELLEPRSFKRRIKDRLMMRRAPAPRVLTGRYSCNKFFDAR